MMAYVTCDFLHLHYEKSTATFILIVYDRCMGNVASSVYVIVEQRNTQYAISHTKVTEHSFSSYMLAAKVQIKFYVKRVTLRVLTCSFFTRKYRLN